MTLSLFLLDPLSLTKIPELSNPSVCMKDPERVQAILESMVKAGSNTVQVISDFDMTLTRFAHNGKRCPTCHNILDNSMLITEDCKVKLKNLLDKYYPIEIDSTRSIAEKLPLMVEWWTQAHELLVQQEIRKDKLAIVVQQSEAMLREDFQLFFDHLHEHSIPLLIFSAGIGDVLEEVIRQAGVFHPNVKVFSNYMDFDECGVLKAFKGVLIHIYNKREGALLNTGHFEELRARPNVVLMGDSLGDLTMADGVQDMENILKIGFLNDKVDERKQSYLDSYDIVLIKDETLVVPNALLLYLTGKVN
ncbi:cytosolic 5'-nucleotidase 3-like isoform X1 [Limanda limanda]|uniref:cytosolic 5'-nucleotidase 3-like isoform X1 n=2 Tax=Limanda limanda TaxID=27771 RepID=UPI0029C7B387|nr:cytosolic 5'-nucleotidase 3-like isoform X1 [Limanda limanda]